MPAEVSVVVPTYKEAANLKPLTERLFEALKSASMDKTTELIFVDDNSNDGSEAIVKALSGKYNARIIVRKTERGLSSAVLRGFDEAKGNILVCMDADLQHPPEKVPELIRSMDGAEFSIGTRYGEGFAVDENWPMHRQVISKGARLLAFPLTPLSDPMTGFFAIQASTYKKGRRRVSPIGFKICMELFVKCGVKKHAEVQILFGVRTAGESKLSSKVMVHYINHLLELYSYRFPLLLPTLLVVCLLFIYFVFSNAAALLRFS